MNLKDLELALVQVKQQYRKLVKEDTLDIVKRNLMSRLFQLRFKGKVEFIVLDSNELFAHIDDLYINVTDLSLEQQLDKEKIIGKVDSFLLPPSMEVSMCTEVNF